jgi:pimeloyl-ACP methyl ester carboxylesterase
MNVALLKTAFSLTSSWAPGLAAAGVERLFFYPKRHPSSAHELEGLATGERVPFSHLGERLAVWHWGAGPTVFLLHGWSGRAGQLLPFVKPLVDAGFSVVAFDAPAHGQSEGSRTSGPEIAAALAAVVTHFGPAHGIIAHSMGGWAAIHTMLAGAPIPAAVLIGMPLDPTVWITSFASQMALPPSVMSRLTERVASRIGVPWSSITLESRLPVRGARALVIHDRGDAEVPVSNAERFVREWPDARLLLTEGKGHRRILRDADVIRQTVEFLQNRAP